MNTRTFATKVACLTTLALALATAARAEDGLPPPARPLAPTKHFSTIAVDDRPLITDGDGRSIDLERRMTISETGVVTFDMTKKGENVFHTALTLPPDEVANLQSSSPWRTSRGRTTWCSIPSIAGA